MDSSDSSNAASNIKQQTASQKENSMLTMRERFCSTDRHQQSFSLPDSIIYYITMKPSKPKAYQLMIKTCKYFFILNPVIVHSTVYCDGYEWEAFADLEYKNPIILTKTKLWVTDQFKVCPNEPGYQNILSSFIPKFYRCDAKYLCICDQVISNMDFLFLSSSAENIILEDIVVKDENGLILALEKIVEMLPKAVSLDFLSFEKRAKITSKTAKELLENPNFSRIKRFWLNHIPEAFDIDVFYDYMKKNNSAKFDLQFDDKISNAYKNRLNEITDEILACDDDNMNYKPPYIRFPGLDYEKSEKLYSVFRKY